MMIKTFPVGMLQENCYIIINEETNEAFAVDPGDEGARLIANIEKLGCTLKAILLTHGHADHVGAVVDLINKFNEISETIRLKQLSISNQNKILKMLNDDEKDK